MVHETREAAARAPHDLRVGAVAAMQRVLTLGALGLAAGVAALGWAAGRPGWGAAAAAGILALQAAVLAFEFLWMAQANRASGAPAATPGTMLQAWAQEVLAGLAVFCWRQPFASRRWPDHLPATARGRRGVLLVHGFVCNRGLWNPWLQRLRALDVPHVAVDLEPPFAPIDDYFSTIEVAVCRLEAATGLAPVVVAHSMGGLVVRGWLGHAARERLPRVHRVLTLGTPHHGTALAGWALSPNARQMRRDSRWLQALRGREPQGLAARFTCFWSHCDNIVFPASTATLPGADNRHLPGTAHVQMVGHEAPWQRLRELLAQAPG